MKKQTNDFGEGVKCWVFVILCATILGTSISQIAKYLKFNLTQVIFMSLVSLCFFLFGVFGDYLLKILKEKLK